MRLRRRRSWRNQGGHAPAPLFASDDEFGITLRLPLKRLLRQRLRGSEVEGTLLVTSPGAPPQPLGVKVRPRGHKRLEVCPFPPLRLNFRRGQVEGTLFAGQNRVKLVTLCRDTASCRGYLRIGRITGLMSPARHDERRRAPEKSRWRGAGRGRSNPGTKIQRLACSLPSPDEMPCRYFLQQILPAKPTRCFFIRAQFLHFYRGATDSDLQMRTTARYPRLIVVAVFCGLPSLAGAVPITHRLDGFEVMVEINSRFLIQLATTDGFIEGVIDSGDVQSAESFGTIVLDIEPGPLDGQVDVVVPQGGIDSGSFRFGTSGNLHLDPLVNPINVFTELDLLFDIGSDPFAGSAVDPIAPFGDMLSSDHVDLDLAVFWNFGMSGFTGTGPFEAAEDGLLDTTVRASGFGQLAELQPTGSQFSLDVGDFAPPPIEIAPRNAAAFTLTPGCDLPEGTFGCRFDILGVQMSVLEFSMTISSIRMFGSQTGVDFAVGPVEPPVSVPEPTTLWLLGAGLIGMCLLKRRQIATARRFAPTLADR